MEANLRVKGMSDLVSILIPCHNAEKWLEETILSALAQTWINKEIIVVDDGSTDDSLSVARKFESRGVHVICQSNLGAGAARNSALRLSKGEYVQYLDGDDLLDKNKIESQLFLLSKNPSCIASGQWARFEQDPNRAQFSSEPVWRNMPPIDWLTCSWLGGGMMPVHAWLIPRSIAEKAGLWNESLSLNDDGEYFCRVILASDGVLFCPEAKCYYRSGISGSLSRLVSESAKESQFRSFEICASHLINREDSARTRLACSNTYQRFVYGSYPKWNYLVQQAESNIENLGGSDLKPTGGPVFKLISFLLGWKLARWLQFSLDFVPMYKR